MNKKKTGQLNKTTYSWWIYKPSKKDKKVTVLQIRKLWKKIESMEILKLQSEGEK